MKKLMQGNEAVARGLYEAGVKVLSSYPGTPSTEISEFAAKYPEIYCEWAPNEKVACETSIGAALNGARAFSAMKHVGLNVAADPLFTVSYIGANGGLVFAVADDPGMHSSQNEQDSRHYAIAAKVPMLEPSDSAECLSYTKAAYEISEKYDTPVLLRLSTRVSHSSSIVELSERQELELKEYTKNPAKHVMMPAMAKGRHVVVEQRTKALTELSENCPFNTVEYNNTAIGVICAGISYQYAREALGDNASYLKIGLINPMPVRMIKDFAAKCDKVFVVEQLDPVIENHCKSIGVEVIGKDVFSLLGEFSQSTVQKNILGTEKESVALDIDLPNRPPVMCCGCPHRGLYYALKRKKVYVSGDIGCYTLGALQPLGMLDTCVCMGASVSSLHGAIKARGDEFAKKAVAVIGDSTFIHSGVTGLINIAYNKSISTVIILDNSITGMTGHQQNPTTGYTIKGDPTTAVNLESLCHAVGIEKVTVVDPYKLDEVLVALDDHLATDAPSVIISRRPCALLKYVKHNPPIKVNSEKCRGCKVCMGIGCPAISMRNGKAVIDQTQCVGCNLCTDLCKFGAINDGGAE